MNLLPIQRKIQLREEWNSLRLQIATLKMRCQKCGIHFFTCAACLALRAKHKCTVSSTRAKNAFKNLNNNIIYPVRDLMLVENAKPNDTPHPVRDETTKSDGFIPTGCRLRGHHYFYQHFIPNGILILSKSKQNENDFFLKRRGRRYLPVKQKSLNKPRNPIGFLK